MVIEDSQPATTEAEAPRASDGVFSAEKNWDRSRFFTAGDLNPCPEVIDLTGRARHLLYGPWANLEPGLWRARVRIELCQDAARRLLAVEFGTVERGWTLVDVPVGKAGPREIVLEHLFLAGDVALITLLLKAAAFHGEVRFVNVAVERLGDEPLAQAEPGL